MKNHIRNRSAGQPAITVDVSRLDDEKAAQAFRQMYEFIFGEAAPHADWKHLFAAYRAAQKTSPPIDAEAYLEGALSQFATFAAVVRDALQDQIMVVDLLDDLKGLHAEFVEAQHQSPALDAMTFLKSRRMQKATISEIRSSALPACNDALGAGGKNPAPLDFNAAIKTILGDHLDIQTIERYRQEFDAESARDYDICAHKFVHGKKAYADFIAIARQQGLNKKKMVDQQFAAFQAAKATNVMMTPETFFVRRKQAIAKSERYNAALKTRLSQYTDSEPLSKAFACYADCLASAGRKADFSGFEATANAFFAANPGSGQITLADFEAFVKTACLSTG